MMMIFLKEGLMMMIFLSKHGEIGISSLVLIFWIQLFFIFLSHFGIVGWFLWCFEVFFFFDENSLKKEFLVKNLYIRFFWWWLDSKQKRCPVA
jgi:hypothetical protein